MKKQVNLLYQPEQFLKDELDFGRDEIVSYIALFGSDITECFESSIAFKDYLCKIDYLPSFNIIKPIGFDNHFDLDFLLRLLFMSMSAQFEFEQMNDNDYELIISVEAEGSRLSRRLTELHPLQLLNLHNIFIRELLTIAIEHKRSLLRNDHGFPNYFKALQSKNKRLMEWIKAD